MADKPLSRGSVHAQWDEPARKRMRITPPEDNDELLAQEQERTRSATEHNHIDKDKDKSITIASTARLAPQAVAPFFAKHIPSQYAPLGDPAQQKTSTDNPSDNNSKFCYRHRPDMLCRRQADEPSMDKLQKDLEALPQEDRQGIVQVWSLFSAAPSRHRNLMLKGILAQCCFPQLSFLSANVRELIRIDFIAALPSEISFKILCFLDTTSLCKAAQVSTKWRQLADDDVVWHRMCEQHIDRKCTKCGWGLPMLERKRLRATKRQIQLRASKHSFDGRQSLAEDGDPESVSNLAIPGKPVDGRLSPLSPKQPVSPVHTYDQMRKTRPWKDVYKDRFKVGTNWKYGRSSLRILKGHTNGVMALQMYDNILATGSYDATIKIWDLDTGKEVRTLTGHTMGVRCLQMDDTKLISGSLDKTLKVWNWRTGECLATYPGHGDGVIGLHFDANILVSGSIDKTARVWNFQEKSVFTLRGHDDWVNAVHIDTPSQTVFTASDDCTVKMWDLETRRCIHTFLGHVCQVQQVILLPPEFEADDDGSDHTSNDPGSPDSSHTSSSFMGHISPILMQRALPSGVAQPDQHSTSHSTSHSTFSDPFSSFSADRPKPPRYMLTSGLDSTIRLWEVHTGRCIRTFFGHLEGVWALAADTLRIVSGAEDRMVKVWDPRTGKCERTFTGHRGPVTCIGLSDSRMASAGEDGEIRVHCFNN